MGMSLKDYVKSMLSIYRNYPEMKQVLKEIYEEWYGELEGQRVVTEERPFCALTYDRNCKGGS